MSQSRIDQIQKRHAEMKKAAACAATITRRMVISTTVITLLAILYISLFHGWGQLAVAFTLSPACNAIALLAGLAAVYFSKRVHPAFETSSVLGTVFVCPLLSVVLVTVYFLWYIR